MLQNYLLTSKTLGYMPNYHGSGDTVFHFFIYEKMRFFELRSSPSKFLLEHAKNPELFKTFYQSRIRRYLTLLFPVLLLGKIGETHVSDFRFQTNASESDSRTAGIEKNDVNHDFQGIISINLIPELLLVSDFRSWMKFPDITEQVIQSGGNNILCRMFSNNSYPFTPGRTNTPGFQNTPNHFQVTAPYDYS